MFRFRSRRGTSNSSKCEVDNYSGRTRRSVSPVESEETIASHKPTIEPASPLSEVSRSKLLTLLGPEASDDLYSLTPVQSKHSIYEIENQKPHEPPVESKRSSISVKKLAFRLGSKIGAKDLKLATTGKVLQKPRPGQRYRSAVDVSPYESTSLDTSNETSKVSLPEPQPAGTYQVSEPEHSSGVPQTNGAHQIDNVHQSNGVVPVITVDQSADYDQVKVPESHETDRPVSPIEETSEESMPRTVVKPLPATPQAQAPPDFGLPPDVGVSADHNLAKLLPPIQASSDLANSIDEKLTLMQAGPFRPTLKDELEATQQKLSQLFESQALLRERYNTEKDKSTKLDAEHLVTHNRIHSLERSTREMNDELRRLYEYVGSLERANKELRGGMRISTEGTMHLHRDDQSTTSTRPVSTSPPISEIQPLRPHPPPIPKKADRRSVAVATDGTPMSRTNSHEPQSANEDISYWRVGDITTIAEAGAGSGKSTPRPLWDHRRSVSMSDDILRKANLSQAPAAAAVTAASVTHPGRAASVRSPDSSMPKVTFLESPPSVAQSRPEVKGFPNASYAPVAASPYGPYSAFETTMLGDSSDQLTPVPTRASQLDALQNGRANGAIAGSANGHQNVSFNGHQNGYSNAHQNSYPNGQHNGYLVNGAEERPVTANRVTTYGQPAVTFEPEPVTTPKANGKARATNGYMNGSANGSLDDSGYGSGYGGHNSGTYNNGYGASYARAPVPSWPEYIEDEPEYTSLRRQSTIKARPPHVPAHVQRASTYPHPGEDLTRRRSPPSVQSSFYSNEHPSRSASRAPSERGVAQTHSSSSGSASRRRKLKLKSSLELLPNCARKEVALDANRQAAIMGKPISPTSNFIQNRGFALYRFVNPKPIGGNLLSYELERLKPSMSTSKIMISEPTTLRVTFPKAMKGIEGTVGMYDSVSEMWLNPHALKKRR